MRRRGTSRGGPAVVRHRDVQPLGPVEQLVLRGDGLTTTSLEILTGAGISVQVRGHWRLPVPSVATAGSGGADEHYTGLGAPDVDRCLELGVRELAAQPGDVLLVRDVLLVGDDGVVYGAAEVVAAAHRLPPAVARELASTDHPIGRLLRDGNVQVAREMRRWGTLRAGSRADVLGADGERSPVLGRTYRMLLSGTGEPLAVLTEWFAPRVFGRQPVAATLPPAARAG